MWCGSSLPGVRNGDILELSCRLLSVGESGGLPEAWDCAGVKNSSFSLVMLPALDGSHGIPLIQLAKELGEAALCLSVRAGEGLYGGGACVGTGEGLYWIGVCIGEGEGLFWRGAGKGAGSGLTWVLCGTWWLEDGYGAALSGRELLLLPGFFCLADDGRLVCGLTCGSAALTGDTCG